MSKKESENELAFGKKLVFKIASLFLKYLSTPEKDHGKVKPASISFTIDLKRKTVEIKTEGFSELIDFKMGYSKSCTCLDPEAETCKACKDYPKLSIAPALQEIARQNNPRFLGQSNDESF